MEAQNLIANDEGSSSSTTARSSRPGWSDARTGVPSGTSSRTVVFAASIGNALEWYDLIIYGVLAIPISKVFFPAHSELVSLLIALATFGASFLMRPIGALCLGSYADRHGRKAGMRLTILIMGCGTLAIAVAPTYAVAGLAAPVIIVCAKFLQGFSAGGEFGTSVSFLVEHAPENRRGLFASFQIVGVGLAATLASLVGFGSNRLFTPAEIMEWAWRIPFLLGLTILPIAWFIRRKVSETPVFETIANEGPRGSPLRESLSASKLRIVSAIGLYCLAASTNYLLGVYIPTYATRELGISAASAFWGTLGFSLVQVFMAPVFGALSDIVGRRILIATGLVLVAAAVIPAFQIMLHFRSAASLIACMACLGILVTLFQAPVPAFLSELFPTRTRTTGLAVIHNLNFTVFGGFAPLLMTLLIAATADRLVPAYYVLITAALAVCGLRNLVASKRREARLNGAV
ncbi:MFS transporter [Caballeronia insecticola]|uniref:Major facilitator superfamily MFS_1 n=1 Tax=Caballeronia insecticola TaxID=758793 RepID=A0A060PKU4_9BURK|nr:MFS transporter [Caballeronia insecticola]BAO94191.1 major facilitator superfamily MFS_1 [Caballeronia insecticola]